MLNNKSVLITGGTGSFGKSFTKMILKNYPNIRRLIIFSRDELKQFEMAQTFSEKDYPALSVKIKYRMLDTIRLSFRTKKKFYLKYLKKIFISLILMW